MPGRIANNPFSKRQENLRRLRAAKVGIITALPKEFAAVRAVCGDGRIVTVSGKGAGRKYWIGAVRSQSGGQVFVAVTLTADMGNNSAAIRATQMLSHCPNVEHIVMVGIAGAIPNPAKVSEHVRLGDIVVSDRKGVVQYDFEKEELGFTEIRAAPRPPSASLIDAVKWLTAEVLQGKAPWEKHIDRAIKKLGPKWRRPKNTADTLKGDVSAGTTPVHPPDPDRVSGRPRIFHGPIASANKLLKNPKRRDTLREQYGAKAVEMEGSGIADATWISGSGYLVVRGTCDYCNPAKGDTWQNYAALAAAAYARSVIEGMSHAMEPEAASSDAFPSDLSDAPFKNTKILKRQQDIVQLKKVFYWIHLGVMDDFFDRLSYTRISSAGAWFHDGIAGVINSTRFHIHDAKLLRLVMEFYRAWSRCFTYFESMDLARSGKWFFFNLPMDVFTSSEQEKRYRYTGKQLQPTQVALKALLRYVRSNYFEIDPNKCGVDALRGFREYDKLPF